MEHYANLRGAQREMLRRMYISPNHGEFDDCGIVACLDKGAYGERGIKAYAADADGGVEDPLVTDCEIHIVATVHNYCFKLHQESEVSGLIHIGLSAQLGADMTRFTNCFAKYFLENVIVQVGSMTPSEALRRTRGMTLFFRGGRTAPQRLVAMLLIPPLVRRGNGELVLLVDSATLARYGERTYCSEQCISYPTSASAENYFYMTAAGGSVWTWRWIASEG